MSSKFFERKKVDKYLKFLTYNVEGLKSKLIDPSFLNMIKKYDIIIFLETWFSDKHNLNIDGFWDYSQVRPKHQKALRNSGGITILIKKCFRQGIQLVKDEEGFIWFKLLKLFFKLDNDLFVCATYIPPQNTTLRINNKTDYWENLTNSLIDYNSKGNILITGDLNARTGKCIEEPNIGDKYLNGLCPIEDKIHISSYRNNCDSKINKYGKKLLQLCEIFNLNIANGKVAGNRLGNFTCFNLEGVSVVDYFICDSTVISNMHEMIVEPPIFNSKHAPITAKIKIDTLSLGKDENVKEAPMNFKWDDNSGETFKRMITSDESLKFVNEMKTKLLNTINIKEAIDTTVNQLTDLFKSTARKTLKLKQYTNKSNKNKKSSKWYDKECSDLKKRLDNLAYLLTKNPRNPYISGKYITCKKEYNKIIKHKKRIFEITDINSLLNLTNNPSQFWKKIKN